MDPWGRDPGPGPPPPPHVSSEGSGFRPRQPCRLVEISTLATVEKVQMSVQPPDQEHMCHLFVPIPWAPRPHPRLAQHAQTSSRPGADWPVPEPEWVGRPGWAWAW